MHARAGRATGAAHWPTGGFSCAIVARVHAAPGQRLVTALVGPLVNSVASLCQVCSFGSRPVGFVCLQARRRGDGPRDLLEALRSEGTSAAPEASR